VLGGFEVEVDAESLRLYVLRRDPGVLWTTSAAEVVTEPRRLTVRLGGPTLVRGLLDLAGPEPRAVRLDGRALPRRGPADARGRGYRYDAAAGTLHVRYSHRVGHELAIDY
jgi:hypothetical protein